MLRPLAIAALLAALPAGAQEPDLKPREPDAASDIGDSESFRREPPRSAYRGYTITALSGGTALLVASGIFFLVNYRCEDCTGRPTPWIIGGAGLAAWGAGAVFWALEPPAPRRPPPDAEPPRLGLAWSWKF